MGNGGFWKLQPRGPLGRWIEMGSLGFKSLMMYGDTKHASYLRNAPSLKTKTIRSVSPPLSKAVRNEKKMWTSEPYAGLSGKSLFVDKGKDWTAPAPKKPKPVNKDLAVVPYYRQSLRSATVGTNVGKNLSRSHRLSGGVYLRLERRSPSKAEHKVAEAHEKAIKGTASKISPFESATPLIERQLERQAQKAINSVVSRQFALGGGATARAGTSRSGTPSVVVQRGYKKVSGIKRAEGVQDYNRSMIAGGHGITQKSSYAKMVGRKNHRPQRRKKYPTTYTR